MLILLKLTFFLIHFHLTFPGEAPLHTHEEHINLSSIYAYIWVLHINKNKAVMQILINDYVRSALIRECS